jgi:hypothetical protein
MIGPDAVQPGPDAHRPEDAVPAIAAAALRDAQVIAARVGLDEEAADAERSRLQREPLPLLAPPRDARFHLSAGELLHAERAAAILEREQSDTPVGGELYLTSDRMLHVATDGDVFDVSLASIADIAVALERLLLVELTDGSGLAIEVDQPRLLRVQLAAARAAARERSG